jgi:hypothetical protein
LKPSKSSLVLRVRSLLNFTTVVKVRILFLRRFEKVYLHGNIFCFRAIKTKKGTWFDFSVLHALLCAVHLRQSAAPPPSRIHRNRTTSRAPARQTAERHLHRQSSKSLLFLGKAEERREDYYPSDQNTQFHPNPSQLRFLQTINPLATYIHIHLLPTSSVLLLSPLSIDLAGLRSTNTSIEHPLTEIEKLHNNHTQCSPKTFSRLWPSSVLQLVSAQRFIYTKLYPHIAMTVSQPSMASSGD